MTDIIKSYYENINEKKMWLCIMKTSLVEKNVHMHLI